MVEGAWGFASNAILTRQQGRGGGGPYRTPLDIDLSSIATEEKIAVLLMADRGIRCAEGFAARRVDLVRDGPFVGYLTSPETAVQLATLHGQHPAGARSGGAMRASKWNRISFIRLTNVSMEPASCDLDDLVAGSDEGIHMESGRS